MTPHVVRFPSFANNWIEFTPAFTGMTEVGTPTYTGRYLRLDGGVVAFQVKAVPGTTIASTAGTTYFALPVACGTRALAGILTMGDLTTLISIGVGVISVSDSRGYIPTQTATGDTLTISGWYES